MQRKTINVLMNGVLAVFLSCLMLTSVQAAKPLWTFVPQTPTDITVAQGSSAQVIYTVQNQSSKAKILAMKPITGVSQNEPCKLPGKGQCTLTLNVSGSALQGDVIGGPVLCLQGNNLQCYQPSSADILRIRLTQQPPIQQFTVTPSVGANGSISPSTAQIVNAGSSLIFTATPDAGFGVNQWLLDGNVVQTGGTSYQLNNIQANHTVQVTFGQTTLSPSIPELALSVNDTATNAALTGNPRMFSITNTGSVPAAGMQVNTSGFPTGTSISSNTCMSTLNASDTCEITITPGNIANADNASQACTVGTQPEPAIVTVTADNAPQTNINVLVLGYGCIYQSGFIFSVDDTTSDTNSIGGKVVSLQNQTDLYPNGIIWSSNGQGAAAADVSEDVIPLIGRIPSATTTYNTAETTFDATYSNTNINPFPPEASFASCNGARDGACNTANILVLYNTYITNYGIGGSPFTLQAGPTDTNFYAAGLCQATIDGYSDWYLPALCDLGTGDFCVSGTQQNIAENLSILIGDPNNNPNTSCNVGSNCLANFFWSSTEFEALPQTHGMGIFFSSGGSLFTGGNKYLLFGARCVRALTI